MTKELIRIAAILFGPIALGFLLAVISGALELGDWAIIIAFLLVLAGPALLALYGFTRFVAWAARTGQRVR